MKNLLLIISLFGFFACNSGTENKPKGTKSEDQATVETEKPENAGKCEEFLADYETWADEIIAVVKKVKKDPMDMQNTQKMMKATQEIAEWSKKWTDLYDCANNEKYSKRMEEIEAKVDKELNQ